MTSNRLIRPVITWLGSAALVVFAALLVWHVGHRGLFIMDHSIVFDGGYRVLSGQIPYKNIYMAYLPGALWVQALFLWLYGVDFSAMVLPAAIFNGIAVAVVIRITLALFPERIISAGAGGFLTALWFQAPFGSVQHEQVAFTWNILALWVLLENWPSRASGVAWFFSGLLTFAGVLCKQNAGVLFVPIALGVIAFQVMPAIRRTLIAWAIFVSGLVAGLCAFLAWLRLYSDFNKFVLHALTIPAHFGVQRLLKNVISTAKTVAFLHSQPEIVYIAIWAMLVVGVVFLSTSFEAGTLLRRLRVASFLTIAVLFYHGLFFSTTLNNVENCMPFLGLAFGLTMAISFQLFYGRNISVSSTGSPNRPDFHISRRTVGAVLAIAGVLVFSVLADYGFYTDFSRLVQEFPSGTTFHDNLHVDRASRVIWGHPTLMGRELLQRGDFEDIVHWLLNKNENFFVFPDATILYGLTGRVSPQPLLYFLENHSYSKGELSSLDPEILRSLQNNDIRIFIQEKDSVLHTQDTLRNFPRTYQWILNNFHAVRQFGPFQVSERNQ